MRRGSSSGTGEFRLKLLVIEEGRETGESVKLFHLSVCLIHCCAPSPIYSGTVKKVKAKQE